MNWQRAILQHDLTMVYGKKQRIIRRHRKPPEGAVKTVRVSSAMTHAAHALKS